MAQSYTYSDGPSSRANRGGDGPSPSGSLAASVGQQWGGVEDDDDDEDDDGRNANRESMIDPDETTGLTCQSNVANRSRSHSSTSRGAN